MRAGAILTLSLAVLPGMLWMPRADAFTGRGPSTPRERAKALKLIRQLEEDPDFDGSRDARRWLSLWLFQVPDLKLDLCPELLGGTPAMRRRIPAEVVAQTMYSGIAYLIENPGKAKMREEVYLAGVLGALRAYEALLKERPAVRSALLDELLGRRAAGTLAAHVAEAMKSCSPPVAARSR
jgi:hypothetical protein